MDGYVIFNLYKSTFHVTDKIINTYRNSDKSLSFIPAYRYLQQLDLVVNKPFKEAFKKLYVYYFLENDIKNILLSRTE